MRLVLRDGVNRLAMFGSVMLRTHLPRVTSIGIPEGCQGYPPPTRCLPGNDWLSSRMETDPLVERYLNHLRVEGGLSRNTVEAYRRDLAKFQSYLQQDSCTLIQQITKETVRRFLGSLNGRKLAAVSSARCLSAVRGWLRFLRQERLIDDNPAIGVTVSQRGVRLPKTLSQREIVTLLEVPSEAKLEDQRDHVMLELLYATGLRVSELVSLQTMQVNFEVGYLRVTGKGLKQRIVPMGEQARRLLQQYMEQVRAFLLKQRLSRFVFVTRRGRYCQKHFPPRSATFVRDTFVGRWSRSSIGANYAWSCQYCHDPNLYARRTRAAEGDSCYVFPPARSAKREALEREPLIT
jgi:integrase/recombinase XerD